MKPPVVIAIVLCAALAGFVGGRVSSSGSASGLDSREDPTAPSTGGAAGSVGGGNAVAVGTAPATGGSGARAAATSNPPAGVRAVDLDGLLALNDPADWFGTATKLGNAVAALSDDALRAVVADAAELSDHDPSKHQVLNAAVSEWARRDPRAALAFGRAAEDRNIRHQLVSMALGRLASQDSGLALKELESIEDNDLRMQSMNSIVQGMMAGDPAGAIALATDWVKRRPSETWPLDMAFRTWAMKDPQAALERAQTLEPGRARNGALNAVAAVWAGRDPVAAVGWAASLPQSENRRNILSQVVGVWAGSDPKAAGEWLLTQKDPDLRNNAVGSVVQNLYNKDKDAALQWIERLGEIGEDGLQRHAYQNLAWSIGRSDPELALNMAKAFPPGQMSDSFARSAVDSAPIEKLPDILRQLDEMPEGRTKSGLTARAIQRIGESDPKRAAVLAEKLPPGQEYTWAFSNLANQWAGENPTDAIAWATSLTDPERRKQAVQGAIGHMAGHDPAAAAKLVESMTGDVDPNVFSTVGAQWARHDPTAALEWAAGLSGEARREALTSAVGGIADIDPVKASEIFSQYEEVLLAVDSGTADPHGSDGVASQAAGRLASQWAQWDPESAAHWGLGLKGEGEQIAAVENALGTWSDVDPIGASEWIAELPDGALRDKAAERLIYSIRESDPGSAFAWAMSLGVEGGRDRMTSMVLRDWASRSPEEAVQQVMEASLPAEQRERLLSEIQPIIQEKLGP